MEPEGSLSSSQKPVIEPCPELDESSPYLHALFHSNFLSSSPRYPLEFSD
jgi:hypothetical protein